MPRVAPGQRKRAYRPKTRSGCQTCKSEIPLDELKHLDRTNGWLVRRVKCDEARPACYPCLSTGRTCDGYGPNTEAPPALVGAVSRSPSMGFQGTGTERWSFDFFRQNTAPQLSGFLGGDFWERLLLQAALHDPSIRHAILALGSLHARFQQDNGLMMQNQTNGWTDDFASENYSQAIRSLAKPLSRDGQQAIDVWLICSILFASLETMQCSYGSAITHIQSGMKILCEVKYNEETRRHQHDVLGTSETPYIPIERLEEMFVRLDHQVTQMVSGPKWEIYEAMKEYAQKRQVPAIFSSLSKARESLVSQWHVASYSTNSRWDPTNEQLPAVPQAGAWQKKSTSILARWSSAYDAYLDIRGDNLTEEKRKGTATLRILRELGSTAMMLTRTKVDDQMDWDVFCPMFRKIVSLAEDILKLDLKPTEGTPTYCMEMSLVRPLFEVTCRCRDPNIRRRAISLLRNSRREEGVWHAFPTSRVAQRVLDIEEAGLLDVRCCEDVLGWARISDVEPVFDHGGRRATLTYSRLGSEHGLDREMVGEVVEW
ncbi:hypothetical protein LARI1_G006301 [Lachnellula arida]|uniref:Zn(2)-C6 fungal-type domain-containing protein n=1 Tax=Lachnellula arida TaxID=1316785 RepID=A0A8T9BDS4_9HELO|nr:hypothetical protein LARI1_G006301 [Lachnellula arida]